MNSLWLVNETDSVTLGLRGTLKAEICFKTVGALSSISWYDSACAPTPEPTLSPTSLSSDSEEGRGISESDSTQTISTTSSTSTATLDRRAQEFLSDDPLEDIAERTLLASDATKIFHCDFGNLEPGVWMSNVDQMGTLVDSCGVIISGSKEDSTGSLPAMVVETSLAHEIDRRTLGSPHNSCGGDESIVFTGGHTHGLFPNCNSQGKVVVLDVPPGSQGEIGGCLNVDWIDPVLLIGVGLFDLPHASTARITLMNAEGETTVITSPPTADRNSVWIVNSTNPEVRQHGVIIMTICATTPVALSYIDVQAESFAEPSLSNDTPLTSEDIDEAEFPWCGHFISGFTLVDQASVLKRTLEDGAILVQEDIQSTLINVTTDKSVGNVRFFLPHGEVTIASPQFQVSASWLEEYNGPIQIRADSFAPGFERFLGSCQINVTMNAWEPLSCISGISGFVFVDENGEKTFKTRNLQNHQAIPSSSLPRGATLAVLSDREIGGVIFELQGGQSIYKASPPFQLDQFDVTPGMHRVKARAYSDSAFSTLMNECEVEFKITDRGSLTQTNAPGSTMEATYDEDAPDEHPQAQNDSLGTETKSAISTGNIPSQSNDGGERTQSGDSSHDGRTSETDKDKFILDRKDGFDFEKILAAARGGKEEIKRNERYVRCGRYFPGYSFKDDKNGVPMPLRHTQVVHVHALSDKLVELVPTVDQDIVHSVKIRLPDVHIERHLKEAPFSLVSEDPLNDFFQIQKKAKLMKIHAQAFDANGRLAGDCPFQLSLDWSTPITCDRNGIRGFYLLDRYGDSLEEYSALRQGQVVNGYSLPSGTDMAVNVNPAHIQVVQFEMEGFPTVYAQMPFSMGFSKFHRRGKYSVRATGYGDLAMSQVVNVCEVELNVL